MGMAAGQARLLSITGRMSDNELRAQIINNNKMRLATQSSQASEAYVAALNDSQMMYTSYDANKTASYQKLTYNALTAYSPYNKQYIVTNTSGNVLLSEADATNYKNVKSSGGDVNNFLECYDLEKKTTYFDNLQAHYDAEKMGILYKTGCYNDEGNEIVGYITGGSAKDVTTTLQAYYDGIYTDTYVDANGKTQDAKYDTGKVDGSGNKIYACLHPGYENAISSTYYNDYLACLDKYNNTYNNYLETLVLGMDARFDEIVRKSLGGSINAGEGASKFEEKIADVETKNNTIAGWQSIFTMLENFIGSSSDTSGTMYAYAIKDTKAEGATEETLNSTLEALLELINNNSYDTKFSENISSDHTNTTISNAVNTSHTAITDDGYILSYNSSGQLVITYNSYTVKTEDAKDEEGNKIYVKDADGNVTEEVEQVAVTWTDENDKYTVYEIDTSDSFTLTLDSDGSISSQNGKPEFTQAGTETEDEVEYYKYKYTDEDGQTCYMYVPKSYVANEDRTKSTKLETWKLLDESPNDVDNMKTVANQIWKTLQSSIYSIWDPLAKDSSGTPLFVMKVCEDGCIIGVNDEKCPDGESVTFNNQKQYQAYLDAAKALSIAILGVDIGESYYSKLGDIEYIHSLFYQKKGDETNWYINDADGNEKEVTLYRNEFEKVYDIYLLDNIMNTYGEPNYTWIDTKNPDENGEAKAQWYENLWNKIESSGYSVIMDGLAASTDWIQYAFESGIVSMEQIDENLNWNPLIWSNCNDITEQTDSAAISKAEAEYNAAMNKIESKDKMYDLELKNIDTEHNSLQTEYDSIKSAVDKNIERVFKLYS